MPSGKVHERINLTLTLVTSTTLLFYAPGLALPCFLGLGLSSFINPDILDTEDSRPEWRLRQLPGGFAFASIFDFLSQFIPHRSLVSHSPVGTLLIALVLFPVPLTLVLVGGARLTFLVMLFWMAGDLVHVGLDFGLSALARRLRS